jgi:hypothetical protein
MDGLSSLKGDDGDLPCSGVPRRYFDKAGENPGLAAFELAAPCCAAYR